MKTRLMALTVYLIVPFAFAMAQQEDLILLRRSQRARYLFGAGQGNKSLNFQPGELGVIAEIRRLFTADEVHTYLDRLERSKFLAPAEPDLEMDDLDEEVEEEPWPDNPVLGAQERLRFSRVRQLLQPGH